MRLRAASALFLVVALLLAFARKGSADEGKGARVIDLYTIGRGAPMYARYGHSLLCVMPDPAADPPRGDCYDFGVPKPGSEETMIVDSYRGKPTFITARVGYQLMIDVHEAQERTIQRQRLPLSTEEVERLAKALEESVSRGDAYAYHPGTANCATKVRDMINVATGDRLRRDRTPTKELNFRELLEEGLSGHPLELALVTLTSGTMNERRPDSWEVQFLPFHLRDAVEARLGARPETVHDPAEYRLVTSTAAGRLLLVLVGAILAGAIHLSRRDASGRLFRITLGASGIFLGTLGLALDVVALTCAYVETHTNWALLALLPTDLALGWLPRRWLPVYAIVRLALLGALVVLEMAGVVHQLVIPVALMAGLPILFALRALRAPETPRAEVGVQSA